MRRVKREAGAGHFLLGVTSPARARHCRRPGSAHKVHGKPRKDECSGSIALLPGRKPGDRPGGERIASFVERGCAVSNLTLAYILLAAKPDANGPAAEVVLPPAEVEVADVDAPKVATGTASVVELEQDTGSGSSLGEILDKLPGIELRRSGAVGSFAQLSVRGLGADNVNLVLDDTPIFAGGMGGGDLSLYPVESIERVEIYRGFGPIRFDGSLGGVVRLVTHPPTHKTVASAHLGYGSELSRSAHFALAGPFGDVRYSAFFGYQGTRGDYLFYDDRETLYNASDDTLVRRRNNDQNLGVARISAELEGPKSSRLRLLSSITARTQGLAGSPTRQTMSARSSEQQAALRLAIDEASLWSGRLLAGGGLDGLFSNRHFMDPNEELGLRVGSSRSQLMQGGADLRLQLLETLSHETELAPRLTWDGFREEPETPTPIMRQTSLHQRLHLGVGVEHRAELFSRLTLVPAVRIDARDDFGSHTSKTVAVLASPRLGALWRIAPCELRVNAGRFHRFPTLLERFGDGGTTAAQPNLLPERGWLADVGGSCEHGFSHHRKLRAELAGFSTRAERLIVFLPALGRVQAHNLGRTHIAGIEAILQADAKLVSAQVAYTFTDARDHSGVLGFDGKRAPGIPAHAFDASVAVGTPRLQLRYELSLTSRIFLDAANLRPTPAHALHNAFLQLDLSTLGTRGLSLRASLFNITDARSARFALRGAPLGHATSYLADFRYAPLPGRTWFTSLLWRSPP